MDPSFPRALGGNPAFKAVDARLKRSGMTITWVNYLIGIPKIIPPHLICKFSAKNIDSQIILAIQILALHIDFRLSDFRFKFI